MRRFFTVVVVLVLMAAFAFGVNRFFASRQTTITQAAVPTQIKSAFVLPGTLFLASGGDIYKLNGTTFTDLHLPPSNGKWTQPSIVPGTSNLLAVVRNDAYSEVFELNNNGQLELQLSRNQTGSKTLQLNHWMFWPRVAPDGNTVYVSYDAPKSPSSYEIELAVWKGKLDGKFAQQQWTDPFSYTGGDVEAVPLSGGGVIYAKYQINGGNVYSRIALQTRAHADPVYLTQASDDCAQPAVSPDGTQLAMVCTSGTGLQSTQLEVAPLLGTTIGTPKVVAGGCLCSAPSWAPDGSGLAYLAPADVTGHFQLWWIAGAGSSIAQAPKQVTSGLDLDATAPPAWTT